MLSNNQYKTKIDRIVFFIERDYPVQAAIEFGRTCQAGVSPQSIDAQVKSILFQRHGESVDKKMAVLAAGKTIVGGRIAP